MPSTKKQKISEEEAVGDLFRDFKFWLSPWAGSFLASVITQQGGLCDTGETLGSKKYDYVVIGHTETEDLEKVIERATARSIPVVAASFIEMAISSGEIPVDDIDAHRLPNEALHEAALRTEEPEEEAETSSAPATNNAAVVPARSADPDSPSYQPRALEKEEEWNEWERARYGKEEEEEEEEDDGFPEESEEEEEVVQPSKAPKKEPYDPDPHREQEKWLDPEIAPYHGPCLFDKISSDIMCIITGFLRTNHIINLWKTGSTKLRDTLGRFGGVSNLKVNLRRRIGASWPTCISYFLSLQSLHVHYPLHYEHMPVENFNIHALPRSLESLHLSIGNSFQFVTKRVSPIQEDFPSLKNLTLEGFEHVMTLSSSELAKLAGITKLSAAIALDIDELASLPRSLIHLSKLTIKQNKKKPGIVEDAKSLPPALESLEISVGQYAACVIRGIHASGSLRDTLRILTLLDVQPKTKSEEVIKIDNELFALLPPHLTSLCFKISVDSHGFWDTQVPTIGDQLCDGRIMTTLPPTLTSLELSFPAILGAQFVHLPVGLRTLRLAADRQTKNEDMAYLPRGLTELDLHGAGISPGCFEFLPRGLTRFNPTSFSGSPSERQWKALPQNLTELTLYSMDGQNHFKFLPKKLRSLTFSHLEDLDDYPHLLKSLPRTVTYLDACEEAFWGPGKIAWPEKLQHLAISTSPGKDQTRSFPRGLKTLILECEKIPKMADLPYNLTKLELTTQPLSDEHIFDLPPYLTSLDSPLNISRRCWSLLPKTLKSVRIPAHGVGELEAHDIRSLVPPTCALIVD